MRLFFSIDILIANGILFLDQPFLTYLFKIIKKLCHFISQKKVWFWKHYPFPLRSLLPTVPSKWENINSFRKLPESLTLIYALFSKAVCLKISLSYRHHFQSHFTSHFLKRLKFIKRFTSWTLLLEETISNMFHFHSHLLFSSENPPVCDMRIMTWTPTNNVPHI